MTANSNRRHSEPDFPRVQDHLTWPPDVILHPDHSITEALLRLREKGRVFAPVVDGDAVVGVLSLRVLPIELENPKGLVQDVMVSTVPFLYGDDPLDLGTTIAAHTEIRHFCVVDREHRLIGILACAETGAGDMPPAPVPKVDERTVRRRLAVTPGRAASEEQGVLNTYAEGPTLFVHGREAHEPLDRPASRHRREMAMKSKL